MARHVLRGPHLAAGVFAVAVLPHVVDRHADAAISPGFHFRPEQPPDHVVVDRQAILREHRVAELLELFQDLVVHAGIVVIRPAQQHHAEPVFALQLFQHLAGLAAHGDVVEVIERAVAFLHGALVLFGRQAQDVLELLVHLALEQVGLGEVDERVQEPDALLLEQVAFLGERRLHRRRRRGHGRTGTAGLHVRRAGWSGSRSSGRR